MELAVAQIEVAAASLGLQYTLTQEDARAFGVPEPNPLNTISDAEDDAELEEFLDGVRQLYPISLDPRDMETP